MSKHTVIAPICRDCYLRIGDPGACIAHCNVCGQPPSFNCRVHFAREIDTLRAELDRVTRERDKAIARHGGFVTVCKTCDQSQRAKEEYRAAAVVACARIAKLESVLRGIINDESSDGVDCAERWERAARRALEEK